MVGRPDMAERAATALGEMARGAESLEEWRRAEEAAGQSHEFARARGEGKRAVEAESVLPCAAGAAPGPPTPARDGHARRIQFLAEEIATLYPQVPGE